MATAVMPNLYQVQNNQLHISYSTSGIDGKPHFHYQNASHSLNFSGEQIHAESTDIGTLVSVRIRLTVDSGSTSFSLLVPTVNLQPNQTAPIQTIGITTVHRFSILPALNAGQTELYSVEALSGTAQHVAF
ncbi:MAG: hypothetical protein QOJ99_2221 [Bryobacterales bacterium]|jgi:hypothetical protein|nr:hypothetical protein [Bryobacterales bacterium]